MVEKSLSFLGEMGSKTLYLPLIAETNMGNAESIVRWIKKGENQYEYDFSVMDRYLDMAEKQMGKPEVVVFNIWDAYMKGTGKVGEMHLGKTGTGTPIVTQVDPATGKTQNIKLPAYPDPASNALWKPLFVQIKARLAKRGIEKSMHLGMITDVRPLDDLLKAIVDLSGGNLPWCNRGHYTRPTAFLSGMANLGYQSGFFSTHFGLLENYNGWRNPEVHGLFERVELDGYPMTKWRTFCVQACIAGDVRGVGGTGADTWYAVRDKNGKRRGRVWERYPESDWNMLNVCSSMLGPGPEGPVATMSFEALREGAQECEALILMAKAVAEKKLDPDFAKRAQQTLDEQRLVMWRSLSIWRSGGKFGNVLTSWRERQSYTGYNWYLCSNWQERSEKLYNLANEIEKKVGTLH